MDFLRTRPIYLQITDTICEDILLKRWPEKERIPSVREMAVMLEVNPNTVQRAYSYLQEQSIIYNRRGIGYFVAENGYSLTLEFKRNDFIANTIPSLLHAMQLLNISFDDPKKIQGGD